jgi:hypothetical protein
MKSYSSFAADNHQGVEFTFLNIAEKFQGKNS